MSDAVNYVYMILKPENIQELGVWYVLKHVFSWFWYIWAYFGISGGHNILDASQGSQILDVSLGVVPN